ncbi:MAG: cobalt-precorrin 5A hydrolase [Thermodesulfobacteriota bacterium]
MTISIFSITENGLRIAEKLASGLGSSDIYTLDDVRKRGLPRLVKRAFRESEGLIFIMATGIVVRTIAPFINGKGRDPAVVVVDEKGKHAISLLSGHLGGANELAREVGGLIGARPVITTATDVNGLPCIEDIARRFNCTIEDIKGIKYVNSAIVNGGSVAFVDNDTNRLRAIEEALFKEVSSSRFLVNSGKVRVRRKAARRGPHYRFFRYLSQAIKVRKDAVVVITNKILSKSQLPAHNSLLLRPKDTVVGIGCDRGVRMMEVKDAFDSVLKKWDLSPLSVRNLASIDIKSSERGLLAFARRYKLSIEFYSKGELAEMPLPSGASAFVMGKVGVGGVCEPAALRSAHTKKIWIRKQKIGRVTVAASKVPFT